MRRVLALLALLGASLAGASLLRRARPETREHVDLYFADGSVVSFEPSSPQAARLLPLARRVLASARG